MVLLLAFTLAGTWQSRWLPRWLAQVLAVVLAAPVATVVVYLPSVGGNLLNVLGHEGLVWGVLSITGTALLIAPLLALGALYRERDAQARARSSLRARTQHAREGGAGRAAASCCTRRSSRTSCSTRWPTCRRWSNRARRRPRRC